MSSSEALQRGPEFAKRADAPRGFQVEAGDGGGRCRLGFRAGAVRYLREHGESWELAASEIAVVGEYTTAEGPFVDDYFFAFVRADGMVFEASFYAAGGNATLDALGTALGGRLTAGLRNSATWCSRVIWPPTLEGAPLFELREREVRSLWHRVRRAFGLGAVDAVLTDQVAQYLEENRT
jgi:hypothetical protein